MSHKFIVRYWKEEELQIGDWVLLNVGIPVHCSKPVVALPLAATVVEFPEHPNYV